MASGQVPQLHDGRYDQKQLVRLINQLRRNAPAPAFLMVPVGSISLLTAAETLVMPANANGWVTELVDIVPDVITGAQVGGPTVKIGSNATFDNVAPAVALGAALVVNQVIPVTLTAPIVSQTNPIYLSVSVAATGPTVLTATVYLGGFFR